MLLLDIFQLITGKSSREFNTVEEVDAYMAQRTGKPLEVRPYATTLCSNRGCTHPVQKRDADAIFEAEMNA